MRDPTPKHPVCTCCNAVHRPGRLRWRAVHPERGGACVIGRGDEPAVRRRRHGEHRVAHASGHRLHRFDMSRARRRPSLKDATAAAAA